MEVWHIAHLPLSQLTEPFLLPEGKLVAHSGPDEEVRQATRTFSCHCLGCQLAGICFDRVPECTRSAQAGSDKRYRSPLLCLVFPKYPTRRCLSSRAQSTPQHATSQSTAAQA